MKKLLFTRAMIPVMAFLFYSSKIWAQCSIGNDMNIMPDPESIVYEPTYDANGMVTSYAYSFVFAHIDEPLSPSYPSHPYQYRVLYREVGSTEWKYKVSTVSQVPHIYFLKIGGLVPCKKYELRFTCPVPFSLEPPGSESLEQMNEFLADEINNAEGNVSNSWEICYSPIDNEPITNIKLTSVNLQNHIARIQWDHLPMPVTYEVYYRAITNFQWTLAGETTQNAFELPNLSSCNEYVVRIIGKMECCDGMKYSSPFSILNFVMTDCSSNIDQVDWVTGNSAHVSWTPIGNTPDSYEVWYYKLFPTTLIDKITTSATEITLTGLTPGTDYSVKVFSKCSPNGCMGVSQSVAFHTNCELHEPNNTFGSVTPVNFNETFGNVNIYPIGDRDIYKFTPTTCPVEVKIHKDGVSEFQYLGILCFHRTALPYKLYDHNFHEVARGPEYTLNNCQYYDVYCLTPGQEYYLAIESTSILEDLSCYTFEVTPCTQCNYPAGFIDGKSAIFSTPSSSTYLANDKDISSIVWSVAGPASLTLLSDPALCKLDFYDVGTVVLTATITHCCGSVETLQKVITVTDECNIRGNYMKGTVKTPLVEGYNFLPQNQSHYTIALDLNSGISFSVQMTPGTGSFSIVGSQILVNQTAQSTVITITLSGENCSGISHNYTFIKGPFAKPQQYPIQWSITPNPTSGRVEIGPHISESVDINSLPDDAEFRIFNQNAHLELFHLGHTKSVNNVDLSSLPPGNYNLSILYGNYLQQFSLIKQ